MKQSEVEIGCIYACMVSQTIQPVKIIQEKSHLVYGYRNAGNQVRKYLVGINQNTGRTVKTSAAKCRYEWEEKDGE
jgi:hypothetical protein